MTPTESNDNAAILPQATGDRTQAVFAFSDGRAIVSLLCSSRTEAKSASWVDERVMALSERSEAIGPR